MNINKNYENLEQSYLFSTIAKKVNEYVKWMKWVYKLLLEAMAQNRAMTF